MRANRGFSLVELSIVLVIIGLLTGGVLTGQSLIRAAELKDVSSSVEQYIGAVNIFNQKYKNYPGDMYNATIQWGKDAAVCNGAAGTAATPGTCNGNGDGRIGATGQDAERFRAWQQMALAGFMPGNFTGVTNGGTNGHVPVGATVNAPTSKVSGSGFSLYYVGTAAAGDANYYAGQLGHVMLFGAPVASNFTYGPILRPEDAESIDTKMDDGKPGTGNVQGFESTSAVTPNCTTTAVASTALYNVTNSNQLCSLAFLTGF